MGASYQDVARRIKVNEEYKPNLRLMGYWEKLLLKGLPLKSGKNGQTSQRVMLFYLKFLIDSIGADIEEKVSLYDNPGDWKSHTNLLRGVSVSRQSMRVAAAVQQKHDDYEELELFANNGGIEFLVDLVFLNSKGNQQSPMKYMMLKNIFVILRHYLLMMENRPR